MKYFTIEKDGKEFVAVSENDSDVLSILSAYSDMNELILDEFHGPVPEDSETVTLSDPAVKILSPIPRPAQDVLCLGINYAAHAEEAAKFSGTAFGGERPYPIFFSKRVNYSQGTGASIPAYEGLVDSLDYECELGVIIGKDARNVDAGDVRDYIFGYTIVNDVSARNLQTRHKQWYFGKSLDGFCPMGPCILSADSISFPPRIPIRCSINDELRQDSNTGLLLTGIPEIISMLSQGMTLKAGTIIATGTPSGVGMGFAPPVFLQHGDRIRMEIEGIGILENYVD